MRYLRWSWLFVLAALCVGVRCPAAVLVEDGRPHATIVVAADAPQVVRDAAADLQGVLRRITGATLPIASDPAGIVGVRVLVGQGAARAAASQSGITIPSGMTTRFDEEAYVVAAIGDTVILAGNETPPYQGSVYAVYDMLHALGCRWYVPGRFGESLPALRTVTVPAGKRTVRPDLRVRNIWYSGWAPSHASLTPEFVEWKRRNRMCHPDFVATYLPMPGDDTARYLLPKERYWDTHPEYYALGADGKRDPGFMCMSNPEGFEAAVQTIVEYFNGHPERVSYSFSPPDAPSLCSCPDCTRAMHGGFGGEGWGDISDAYFDYVMRVADRVAKLCPGKIVTSMAYANRIRPPVLATARVGNLLMYLASLDQCSLHTYDDRFCWSRQVTRALLERWSGLCAGLIYYEYDPHDISMLHRPTWRSQGVADDFRLLRSLGGWGFNDEGQCAWLATGLNYYVRARLAWNVNDDPRALLSDFTTRFFGPSAPPMLRLFQAVEASLRTSRIDRPYDEDFASVWPRPFLERCMAMLDEARAGASAEPYRTRVAAYRALFERRMSYLDARDAMARGEFAAARACGQAMIDGVAAVGNVTLLADAGAVWNGTSSGAAIRDYATQCSAYTDGRIGRLVAMLPRTMSFRADPTTHGLVMGWFQPKVKAADWRPIDATQCWYDQGVLSPAKRRYTGVAWYRTEVAIPDAAARGPVALMIPSFKGSALSVWCNGRYAGYVSQSRPRELRSVDLAGLARPGRNLFAFRITAEGGGGLMLPPLVYTPTGTAAAGAR